MLYVFLEKELFLAYLNNFRSYRVLEHIKDTVANTLRLRESSERESALPKNLTKAAAHTQRVS